jgi:hypothetical protein
MTSNWLSTSKRSKRGRLSPKSRPVSSSATVLAIAKFGQCDDYRIGWIVDVIAYALPRSRRIAVPQGVNHGLVVDIAALKWRGL